MAALGGGMPNGRIAGTGGRGAQMSWQAGVWLMLGLTLLGGFAWYERSRPPSQIVALVAALAAISVAGRVAFSPIPNVVPTTDIDADRGVRPRRRARVRGRRPVGAGLQFLARAGPVDAVADGGLGSDRGRRRRARRRSPAARLGRFGLAAVCALAGLAYGALLDFSLMVTYGGEQSLDRFLALSARGIPFNVAHAAGNAALALVAGPAMVRMLIRYRRRFEFAWKPAAMATPRARGATAGAAS